MGLEQKGIYQSKTRIINYQSLHLWWFRDTFIYEYVGDVVNTPSFKKRMREYGEEGIQHFYFMMLQKDQVRATSSCSLPVLTRLVHRCH